ncbi:hypothetical protein NPIL_323181 [Nephila pilipes]|uniref:Uncharacterized protein n=1 Tax=Nephila pilipes TaxID=299642 RepID=A0A8X6PPD9_NEPPI|nr:hypothetical protein NPIL_323181 [Nephila pilipes]
MCLWEAKTSEKSTIRVSSTFLIIANPSEVLANASVKKVAVEERLADCSANSIAISGEGTGKMQGHTSLFWVCTEITADCENVLDIKSLPSRCKGGFGGRTVPYEQLREEPELKDEAKLETVVHYKCYKCNFRVRLKRDFDPIVCSIIEQ